MEKKKTKLNKFIASTIIFALFFSFFAILITFADSNKYEISNFDELVQAAEMSRQEGHQNDTYILKNNIEIPEGNQISFGSSEYPFKGTFDGSGYSISNLKYESTLDPKTDTGLFSYTGEGAIIKNLTLLNADVQADYRGGLIAGYSEGTTFENITIKDSHLFVAATNNVLTLITDGGIRGGAIVGEAKNSVIYNCESINTTVNTNNTSAVAALSGKGLYLGGLVGTSVSTTVEYSRVVGGLVKEYYDVAVGALGGNTLYIGGIVGQMKEQSKVIDSYSTAELNYYCATYVSVGAGNTGNIGGIAGAMFGSQNEVIRSVYSGKATSQQYNAILVIPIIQNNVNISGITNVYEGGNVQNTYYKPSSNPDVSMKSLGSSTQTGSFGPLTDEQFIDKEFWKSEGYDLHGNIIRDTSYNNNHSNKWVIDKEHNFLVHGKSISATLDFVGAGSVTIKGTQLVNAEVTTENPYSFALQGIDKKENTANIIANENPGYRLVSWYKIPNIMVDKIEENHKYFDDILNENNKISNEKELNNVTVTDNDLFVAHYQTQVLYHDINGNIIDTKTGNSKTIVDENDWYDYEELINCAEPVNKPNSENAKLIGWTTTKSEEAGGGYSSITSPELIDLKNDGTFYEVGDKIIKTMDLYPVYVDTISNVETVFEGNEQDSINDESLRDGVGYTEIKMNESQNVVITVIGEGENGTFPEGYRFLGWYDENGNKVSKETSYELKDVDLTQKHKFTAKFEYLVEYYVRAFGQNYGNGFKDSQLFISKYEKYNTEFENIPGPAYIKENITHWGTEHKDHGQNDDTSDAYSGKITKPLKVYSHNYVQEPGGQSGWNVFMTTDFPGSGRITDEVAYAAGEFKFTPVNDKYKLQFWTLERSNDSWTYVGNPMNTGILTLSRQYKGMAMVTADIVFHKKQGEDVTVTRRYENNLFMEQDTNYTYKYPFWHTDDEVDTKPYDSKEELNNTITLQKSPADAEMKISGYVFLGWISSKDVKENSSEWNYIYDVEDDLYCTSDINKVKPYLLEKESKVLEAIDVYPVYAKYNVETKTNVNINLPEEINANKPEKPGYTINESSVDIGKATVVLTPDVDTYVIGNSGEKYVLSAIVRVYEDGTEEEITKDEKGIYKYEIEAGKKYTFMAKYETVILVYHLNSPEVKTEIKKMGETIGEMPRPTYDIEDLNKNYIFVGWSNKKPSSGYHKLQEYSDISDIGMENSSDIINNSMELWPVYVKIQIKVNSNIDDYLKNNGINLETVRFITRPDIDKSQIEAKDVEGYDFIGWYKNYTSENNKGELLTKNKTYLIQKENSLQQERYTAVYVKAYRINYYDTKGEVIYSVGVKQDENRTFVNEALDNEGNKVVTPIDYQAYQNISNELSKNEIFRNWQWVKNDGTTVQWNNFYDKEISQDMDLYPIVREFSAIDSENKEIDTIGTNEKMPDLMLGMSNEKIYGYFTTTYNQPKLTIHVEDILYSKNNKKDIEKIDNMEVILYKNNDITKEPLAIKKTDINGDAIIEFMGEIIIKATTEENKADSFIFQILDKNDDIVSEILISSNESKTIKIPYGEYKIVQKNEWSWRYSKVENKNIEVNTNNDRINISYEENKENTKWFDFTDKKENEYK